MNDLIGRITTLGYDLDDVQTVTDPLNRTTTRYTDPLGRVNAVTDALGRSSELHYDVKSRVQDTSDPYGATKHYS